MNKAEFGGMKIDLLDLDGAVRRIVDHAATGPAPAQVIASANSQGIREYAVNPGYRAACDAALLTLPDGMSLVFGLRLLGVQGVSKVSGSDLMPRLCEAAAQEGLKVFLLGGRPGSAEEAARILERGNPGLRIAGTACPPLGFEKTAAGSQAVTEAIRRTQPHLVFVAFGVPKQELWIDQNLHAAGAPVMMGVGGTFEMIAGRVRRAPSWIQNMGLEWLFRLVQDPGRLAGRYLSCHASFAAILVREFWTRRIRLRKREV